MNPKDGGLNDSKYSNEQDTTCFGPVTDLIRSHFGRPQIGPIFISKMNRMLEWESIPFLLATCTYNFSCV